MAAFARQTVALLDHLELERAVVGGTSLGANITLEVASQAPERLQGMVIEMPVLDNAIPACGAAFTPLLIALKFGDPAMAALSARARRRCRARRSRCCSRSAWTGSPRTPSRAPRCWAASSTAASPPITTSAARFTAPGAGHRPPPRSGAPVLRRRDARLRAPQRPADPRQLDPRAAPRAQAADRGDRGLRR